MEPITRKEMYLAKMSGEDVVVPEPITREEQYLYAICSGGGGASAELEERVTAVEGTVGTLNGSVNTLKDETIPSLENRVLTLEGSVFMLEGNQVPYNDFYDLQGQVGNIDTRLGTLEDAVTSIDIGTIEQLQSSLSTIDDINKRLTALEAAFRGM